MPNKSPRKSNDYIFVNGNIAKMNSQEMWYITSSLPVEWRYTLGKE
jgi:hypothetical protein